MADKNFVVKNGLEIGPTKIFAGNGTIIMGGGLSSSGGGGSGITFSQDLTVQANLIVSPDSSATAFVASAGLTDAIFAGAKDVDSFVQMALHNGDDGASASTDFIAYADTGDNTSGYIDMGIASSLFDDPAFAVTKAGDGYIFVSAPAYANASPTGGNLVLATADGSFNDIVFAAGGFATGEVQGRFVNGDGLHVTGNLFSKLGAMYQGVDADLLVQDSTETTTLNGAINDSQTTITVVSTSAFKSYGVVTIGSEDIRYTSKSSTQLLGCTRGFAGTTAASASNGATVSQHYVGLTNVSGVFTGDVDAFQQFAIKNRNTGSSASTDLIAYSANGDNDSGWVDLGITSGTYNDTNFGVTGPNDGYIFMSAPAGALGNGSMFISTSDNGQQNDIVFSTNGFASGSERMRIVGESRAGKPAGVEIYINTQATSTDTGALRVQGGIGLQGNLYVGGNVNIVGNISFGGQGTSVTTTNITVDAPISFLGNANPGDTYDLGVVGQYVVGGVTKYNGLVRQASTGLTRFFADATTKPTNNVTFNGTHAGLVFGSANVANSTVSTSTTTGALVVAGGVGIAGALYAGSIFDNGTRVVSTSSSAGNLTISGTGINLASHGPGATTVGSSSAIPVVTTDVYGRITALSTASISTTLSTAGGSGTGTVALASQSLTISGGTGITTSASAQSITVTNSGVTGITGTSNQITASAGTGSVTLSLPQNIHTGASPTFAGATLSSITKAGTNGTGDIGQTDNRYGTVWATTFSGVSTTAQYADLAENYLADREYEAGTVLEFSGSAEVTSAAPNSNRVAGIVSTNPGYLMNAGLKGQFVTPVAFTGRVPCKVLGPVRKGDMMISAGQGMAKASMDPKIGTVIGKALADFNGATGIIEVAVGRY